jgi:hypothetical protein
MRQERQWYVFVVECIRGTGLAAPAISRPRSCPGANIVCYKHYNFIEGIALTNLFFKFLVIRNIANAAGFVAAMERFGFEGVDAFDIVNTGKKVREELDAIDPEKAAGL